MVDKLNVLEKKLAEVFKGAPKIPKNGQKSLVDAMPWIALVFGVLQVIGTIGLWNLGHRANDYASSINRWAAELGVADRAPELNLFYWLAVGFAGVSALMLLLAYPGLKERKKAGWNWMFYGALLNAVYGVAALFFDKYYGGGFSRLFGAVVGTAISLWILFQIRDHYTGVATVEKPAK